MDTLADSEDTNEMQHYAAFHSGLHCLLRLTQPSRTKIHHNLENSTFESLKITTGSAKLIASILMGYTIRIQKVYAHAYHYLIYIPGWEERSQELK